MAVFFFLIITVLFVFAGIIYGKYLLNMNIINRLTFILDAMVEDTNCALASYQYNDKPTANVVLDRNMADPTAILFQLTDWELDWAKGTIKERASINISFLKKEPKLDAKGDEQEAIIDEMKDIAIDFLQRLNGQRFSVGIVDDKVKVKSIFMRSDSNRTGVNLEFELEEVQGSCF